MSSTKANLMGAIPVGDRSQLHLETSRGQVGPSWSLFVAGDCCLDPSGAAGRQLLAPELERRVATATLSVVNLEAPVPVPDAGPIPKSGPALTTAADTPERLAANGFDVATLANNHLFDYGYAGLEATRDACASDGLSTVGAGEDRASALDPLRTEVAPDVELALFSVCEREFGVAGPSTPGTAWSDHPSVDDAIRSAAETADCVVVVAHGGVEYVPFSPPGRRERLRQFVDAGADLVVGHHPHVAQGWEQCDGGIVFHSLGNFLFDRQADGETTGWGLSVKVRFAGASPTAVELVPTEVDQGTVTDLGENRSRADHLEYLHRLAACTADDDRFPAYWQDVAVRLFHERYWNWLQTDLDEARLHEIDRLTGSPEPVAAGDADGLPALLALLNVVRNESHRDVVTTALAVMTGEASDHRTRSTEATVDELLSWTAR
jgi:poly-gamma-glutamate capsule biosynthesis protein CapA/YwtB (metallophosphatase superfamily)